ncbi:MAG: hypothetical protein ACOCWE_06415 [Bacillota bacterium]
MKELRIVVFAIIIILFFPTHGSADSNSLTLPEFGWSSGYYLESDNLSLTEILKFRDGLRVDLNDKAANLYFLNRSYYSLNLMNNIQVGYFDYQEYYFSAEQGLVDFLSKISQNNLAEGSYRLKGGIDFVNLQGYYIGKRFNISEMFLVDFRWKYINSGHLEKSKYDGRARMSEQFIYQSGYRQVIISRDKISQPKGISLDIAGKAIMNDNLSIRFSIENLYSYIVFKNLYFREMLDRTGKFYYDDVALRITPIYQVDFDYRSLFFGVSYINRYEPYLGYRFKLGEEKSIQFGVELSLHRSKYGIKVFPEGNKENINMEFQFDKLNFKKAKNLSLCFSIFF